MPITFRDHAEVEDVGLVGYLRFVADEQSASVRGALFIINGRGEPVDFSFSRAGIQASFLWRNGEAQRHAIRALSASLFSGCGKEPSLLLARAEEVPPLLLSEDLEVKVPTARVSSESIQAHAVSEIQEDIPGELHMYWVNSVPQPDSQARQLVDLLVGRGLFLEPFERAAQGIHVAFTTQ